MFTWICPKCKMEVPPHLSECPNCVGTQTQPAAVANGEPVSAAAPPAPQQAVPQQAAPPRQSGLPGWLVSLLVAGGLVGGGVLMYLFFLPGLRGKTEAPAAAKVETPGTVKTPHPYAKFLEVTGIRVAEDKKKNVQIKFLVVNHSLAEIADTELRLDIRSSTAKPGDTPLCEVRVKVPSLGPHESRDITAAGKTQLRAYEMPDWQFLRADYEILSPR